MAVVKHSNIKSCQGRNIIHDRWCCTIENHIPQRRFLLCSSRHKIVLTTATSFSSHQQPLTTGCFRTVTRLYAFFPVNATALLRSAV